MSKYDKKALAAWLEKETSQKLLRQIARSILRKLQGAGHTVRGLNLDLEEVEQELALILVQDETAVHNLVHGGKPGLIRARKTLHSRMIDLSRSKDHNQDIHKNTWQLFYRHVLDLLGKSEHFVKTRSPHSHLILFSLGDPSPLTVATVEDFLDIPYPSDLPTHFERVNTKDVIPALAGHFWSAAAERARDPNIRFSVNDFIVWVRQYVPLSLHVDSHPTGGEEKDTINPLLDHPGKADRDSDTRRKLEIWAQNFCCRLDEKEKKAFFFRQCKELPHKEVSALMGKKGNLAYWMDKTIEKLKSFMRPLDLLAPEFARDEAFKEDFEFFIHHICICLGSGLEETYP